MLVFSTGIVIYCPSNLLSDWLSPPPSLCEEVYYIHVYSVLGGGGVWGQEGRGPRADKIPAAKSLFRSIFSIFLDNDI
jgi:hypothetical protein